MAILPTIEPQTTRLSTAINAFDNSLSNSTQSSDATNVPSERQTSYGVVNLGQVEKKRPENSSLNFSLIRSRKGAPSAITAESYLLARAMLDEVYTHNMAAIKREYLSNVHDDAPRFFNTLGISA